MTYNDEVSKIWRHGDKSCVPQENNVLRELVRYGTLAPSSHNTQCWKFQLSAPNDDKKIITVLPDFTRRCPIVDPDDHHLYATLGCAVENIVVASKALGWDADVDSSSPSEGIVIRLTPCERDASPLFEAIIERQCTRTDYDGKPLNEDEVKTLKRAGTGDGVQAIFFTDPNSIDPILDYIIEANSSQIQNPDWVKELKSWIRFGESDAVKSGDGLYGACMGNPSVPKWIGNFIFDLVLRSGPENAKIRRQVKSSAGLVVFVSEKDDPVHWVEAGRCYERFALQSTAMGIRNAFLNMPVEESDIRPRFATALGLKEGMRPDLVVRFGRGPKMPSSLRRPVESVLHRDNY